MRRLRRGCARSTNPIVTLANNRGSARASARKRACTVSLIAVLAGCAHVSSAESFGNDRLGGSGANTSDAAQIIKQAQADGTAPRLNFGADLAGPDDDGNGVRDDIDAYVDGLMDTGVQKAALRRLSKSIQSNMLAGAQDTKKSEIRSETGELLRAMSCMYIAYGSQGRSARIDEIERYTLNTFPRLQASEQFDQKIDGHVLALPSGEVCDAK